MITCNRNAIVRRMKEKHVRHEDICKALVIEKNTWHKKLSNKRQMAARQAKKVCDLLGVSSNKERDELFAGFTICDFDAPRQIEIELAGGTLVVVTNNNEYESSGGLDLLQKLASDGFVDYAYIKEE
mgnify:CR=1 FL=1